MIQPTAVRGLRVFLVMSTLGLIAPSGVRADGNMNFFFGQKMLEEADWSPVENQGEFGAELTFGRDYWPVHMAVDVLHSADDDDAFGINVKGRTSELGLGVRKVWTVGRTRPQLGGGLALVYGKFEGSLGGITVGDDDTVVGAWIGGGVFWRIGRAFNLGVSARYSKATVTLFGSDGEGGGTHAGLVLGWGWPAARKLPRRK